MGVPEERISYFPNWAETVFRGSEAEHPPVPLPSGFRVMYAGNIGAAQDFPAILEAAERLKTRKDIHWIIVGDGREAQWVREQVGRRGLGNTVHLLGSFPPEQMRDFFAHADAMLVSLKTDPIFALTIPAKLQAYMACGRPVVAMLDGEGARIVTEAQAGVAVPAGRSAELADAVLRMAGMERAELDRMGQRASEYNNANFQRDMLFRQLESWMTESAAQPLATSRT
jgi:glycosyltransferase involved in cell wall biosynthesis